MSDDNTQASIAELKEAVSNLKEFTKRAEKTLEDFRKENKDGRHELRNEFNTRFVPLENKVDVCNKEIYDIKAKLSTTTCESHNKEIDILKKSVRDLEKVKDQYIGGLTIIGIICTALGVIGGWIISILGQHKVIV